MLISKSYNKLMMIIYHRPVLSFIEDNLYINLTDVCLCSKLKFIISLY